MMGPLLRLSRVQALRWLSRSLFALSITLGMVPPHKDNWFLMPLWTLGLWMFCEKSYRLADRAQRRP